MKKIPESSLPDDAIEALAPRRMVIEGQARVGSGTQTKHIRVTYNIPLGMADIFRSEIESAIKARVMSSMEGIFKVAVAELGGDAGVTGMAAWAEYIVENRGDGS